MSKSLNTCVLFCDWHIPDFLPDVRIDLDAYFEGVRRTGAETLIFMAKTAHGNCLYPSKVGFTTKAMQGDIFGEVCRRSREMGLQFIAYYNMILSYSLVPLHPEWRQVDREGKPTVCCFYPAFCMSNPEFERFTSDHVGEIAANYDVDGFFFDLQYFAPDGCYCPACKSKFLEMFGYELAPEGFAAGQWLDLYTLQAKVREDYIHASVDAALAQRSDLIFSWNGSGNPQAISPTLGDRADFLSTEAHPPGYLSADYRSRYCQGMGRPFTLFMPEGQGSWGDWTLTTEETMKGLSAVALAHGGGLNIDHVPYPCGDRGGTVPSPVWDVIGETYDWVKKRAHLCVDKAPVPVAACIHSTENVRLLQALGQLDQTAHLADETGKCEGALLQLMLETHIPIDIRPDNLPLDELCGYELLVLPYVPYVSEELAGKLRSYVSGGGNLVAAYHTSLLDAKGKWRENFGLADLFGVDYVETSAFSVSYLDRLAPLFRDTVPDMPLLIKDSPERRVNPPNHVLYCRPGADAKVLATIMDPVVESEFDTGRYIYHDHSPPGAWTDFPGVVSRPFGKGQVVYLPVPFFQAYAAAKSPHLKELFRILVTCELRVSRQIRIEAPVSVKAALMQDDEGWLLHLIHAQKQTDSMYLDRFARRDTVRVRVRPEWPVAGVKQCLDGKAVPSTQSNRWTAFEVVCPADHNIVRIGRSGRAHP